MPLSALEDLRREPEAAALRRDVLERRKRLLGPDDPAALSATNSHAAALATPTPTPSTPATTSPTS
ncbi:hypothetical protein [Streptomyces bauhiniae]|uniref:hypothetical protein n=1 Tax=Streptomyces bauhiniae TaxID=2340725 RepID=UPI0035DEA52C